MAAKVRVGLKLSLKRLKLAYLLVFPKQWPFK